MKNAQTDAISKQSYRRLSRLVRGGMLKSQNLQSCESTFYIPTPPPETVLQDNTSQSLLMPVFHDSIIKRKLDIPKRTWKNVDVKVMAKVRMQPRPDPTHYLKLLRNARNRSSLDQIHKTELHSPQLSALDASVDYSSVPRAQYSRFPKVSDFNKKLDVELKQLKKEEGPKRLITKVRNKFSHLDRKLKKISSSGIWDENPRLRRPLLIDNSPDRSLEKEQLNHISQSPPLSLPSSFDPYSNKLDSANSGANSKLRNIKLKLMRYMGSAGVSGSHSRVSSVPDLKLVLPQCESISKIKDKAGQSPDTYDEVSKLFPQYIPVLRQKREINFSNSSLLKVNGFQPRKLKQTSTPYLSRQIATHSRSTVNQAFDNQSRNEFLHSLGRITSCSSSQNSQNRRSTQGDRIPQLNADLQPKEIKIEEYMNRGTRRVVFERVKKRC